MTQAEHSIIALLDVTKAHLRRLLSDGMTHLSGLSETSFVVLSPQTRTILLHKHAQSLAQCTRCPLSHKRQNIVFGEGNGAAELMFIGEGPGEVEDKTGRPFVGPAGELLDKIIGAMNLTRSEVYISNIVKCRPPGNRDPEPEEIAACLPFLKRQIEIINPKIIVTLGAPATHTILQNTSPISRLRGRFARYRGIPVMPTYHPSYLLRNPASKRETWADMRKVMHFMKTGLLDDAR